MSRRSYWVIAILVIGGLWFLFRPELLFVTSHVDETRPGGTDEPVVVGTFESVAHETRGTASIYEKPAGGRVLRLEDFEASNGPDVHVILVAAESIEDSAAVRDAGYVSLGAMKATSGNQNYDLPDDIDLERYRVVSIWCRRFSVNFGDASLR